MKLHYFDIFGRAESIRLLLAHAKVEYEDNRVNGEQVAALKASGALEFGQVPALEKDGKNYAQSWSILRLLGQQHGYYPTDAETAYKIDSLIDGSEEFFVKYFRAVFEKDADKKKALLEEFLAWFPRWAKIVTDRLTQNESQLHLVGKSYTIADFTLGAIFFDVLNNEAAPFYAQTSPLSKAEDHPVLATYVKHLSEELKEYLAKRPQPRPF